MFKIEKNPTFAHEVKVQVPVDGGFETQSFKARFKLLTADALAEYDTSTTAGMNTFLKDVVVDLEDIVDDNNEPVPFSDRLRDQVIGSLPALNALFNTYISACSQARLGN